MNSKNILKKSCLQECAKKWVAITAGTLLCCSIYFSRFHHCSYRACNLNYYLMTLLYGCCTRTKWQTSFYSSPGFGFFRFFEFFGINFFLFPRCSVNFIRFGSHSFVDVNCFSLFLSSRLLASGLRLFRSDI